MLNSLNFHRVYTAESIGDGLFDGRFERLAGADDLDDQSLFKGLTTFLRAFALKRSEAFFCLHIQHGDPRISDVSDMERDTEMAEVKL